MRSDSILLHNPKCSKSREAFAWIQENKISCQIVEYLKEPPTESALILLCELLNLDIKEIIRYKEAIAQELGITKMGAHNTQFLLSVVSKNPILLERPIYLCGNKAVAGRPLDNIISLATEMKLIA